MGYADDLQAVSVDEALIEVTSRVHAAEAVASASQAEDGSSAHTTGDQSVALAEVIRERVKSATGCTVSIGVSHNIMLARLATRRAKPDGAFHLLLPDLPSILDSLELDDLHGFGRAARQKAREKFGSSQLKDLKSKTRSQLCEALGKALGDKLFDALRGADDRRLESDKPRKSVSCDINVRAWSIPSYSYFSFPKTVRNTL
jgi:DNA repair protein REV1